MLNLNSITSFATGQLTRRTTPSWPVFPLPLLDGQAPVLLIFDQANLSIAIAYEKSPEPGGALVRATTRRTTRYHIPRCTPVFAVSDGLVLEAREQADGRHRVVIDHGNGWITVYGGLDRVFVRDQVYPRPPEVGAGYPLGILTPSRAGPLEPLELELWRAHGPHDREQIDPLRHIRRWRRLEWRSEPLTMLQAPRAH